MPAARRLEERRPGCDRLVAMLRRARRASFTSASVRNARATSGSSSTTFVPAVARLKYLPRTPPFRLARSYSGRRSSVRLKLLFRVLICFATCGLSGADDTDAVVELRMRDEQKTAPARVILLPPRKRQFQGPGTEQKKARLTQGPLLLPFRRNGLFRYFSSSTTTSTGEPTRTVTPTVFDL